jgi:hypothetical protein
MTTKLVPICETKYSKHIMKYISNDENDKTCEILQIELQKCVRKIDFLPDNIPIEDEINLLKSYRETFDDENVNTFIIEEIKGRYRHMLGLKPVDVLLDYIDIEKH